MVSTENGEIMLLENTGEYMQFIASSPMGNTRITCVVPYSKGFLAGTENGEVIIYEQSSDPPYVKRKTLIIELEQSTAMIQNTYPIRSMCLQAEEILYI